MKNGGAEMISSRLQTLITVAELGSFTKAATALSLTQPAVSHHISQLEEELRASLFVRGKTRLALTPEGEIALKYARRSMALYNKMLDELNNARSNLTKLRVGLTHTAESNFTTEVLAKTSALHKGLSITITTDTINNLYTMLENFEIDLAIVEGAARNPQFNTLLLDTDHLLCVMSTEHRLSRRAMVTLADLRNEQMILRLPTSATRELFEATLRGIGDSIGNYNIAIEVDNIATIKDLVRKDMGISILPVSACMDELRKGKIAALPIENLSMARETMIVYNRDFSHPEILQEITGLYRNVRG